MPKSTVTSGASHEPGREPDGWPVPAEPEPEAAAEPVAAVEAAAEPEDPAGAPEAEPEPEPVKASKAAPSLAGAKKAADGG